MRRNGGFTLIELSIAIVIMLVIIAISVPSVSGVLADRRLRRSLDDFNSLVRQAHERSIAERRSYLIMWRDGKVGLRPEAPMHGEARGPVATWKLNKGESMKVFFPAAMLEDPPLDWIFWPSGNCEPAVVSFRGKNGGWTAKYSALTARAEIVNYVAK